MSRPIRPTSLQRYFDELEAYQLRFAAWLGLDPHEVADLDEAEQPVSNPALGLEPPPDLLVTWTSFDKIVRAEEHEGRHALRVAMRSTYGEPNVFTNSVVLDWSEVERLRREVGARPSLPEPAGGWPARWPKS